MENFNTSENINDNANKNPLNINEVKRGLILSIIALVLATSCYIKLWLTLPGLILAIYSLYLGIKGLKSILRKRSIITIVISIISIVFSSVFIFGDVSDMIIVNHMAKTISNELDIQLINKSPDIDEFDYDATSNRVYGSYFYIYDDEEIKKMNNYIKNSDKWSNYPLGEELIDFIDNYKNIDSSLFNFEKGYYLIYNRQNEKFEVPKDNLLYDFVLIFYIDSGSEYNLYLYDISNTIIEK